MERATHGDQIRLMTRQRESMTNFWQLWLMSSDLALLMTYRSQCTSKAHKSTVRSADTRVIFAWLPWLTTGKQNRAELMSEQKYLDFCLRYMEIISDILTPRISVFTLTAAVMTFLPFHLTCWSAHMCRATIKVHIQNSRGLNTILQLFKRIIGKMSPTVHQPKITATPKSVNHQVILLSCDFLSFPSLHQKFRGQEDLSAVTERIMGVGIPLAVITTLFQHLVLSLPLFSHLLSLCLFCLVSPDRLRSN